MPKDKSKRETLQTIVSEISKMRTELKHIAKQQSDIAAKLGKLVSSSPKQKKRAKSKPIKVAGSKVRSVAAKRPTLVEPAAPAPVASRTAS